jgi:hypothetical protein
MKYFFTALLSLVMISAFAQIEVSTNGNVGVGTAPASNTLQKLSVDGFVKIRGDNGRLMLENPSVTRSVYLRNYGGVDERLLQVLFGETIMMVMNDDGNMGIGDNAPSARLSLRTTGTSSDRVLEMRADGDRSTYKDHVFLYSNSSAGYGIAFGGDGHHRGGIYALSTGGSNNSLGDIGIWARSGGSIFLEASKVGIGTTTPDERLEVNGTLSIGDGTTYSNLLFRPVNAIMGYDGTFEILSNTIPGSGIAKYLTHFKTVVGGSGGQTRHDIAVDGSVGIGTTTPGAKLHVFNGNDSYGAILANANESAFSLYTKTFNTDPLGEVFRLGLKHNIDENNGFISFYRGNDTHGGSLGFSTAGIQRIRIDRFGKVGVGVADPTYKLDVAETEGNLLARFKDSDSTHDGLIVGGDTNGGWLGNSSISSGEGLYYQNNLNAIRIFTNGNEVARFNSSGDLGIGTTNMFGYKLAVNGKIGAEDMILPSTLDPWPDYVFESDYNLLSLEEVEEHINEKGHLPNIPSAKEVEEKGSFSLGEMNNKLLEKVEELMLYTIQQEKRIKALEEELKKLKQ